MKRTIAFITVILMVFLSACGSTGSAKIDLNAVYTEIGKSLDISQLYQISAEKAEDHFAVAQADCVSELIAMCEDNLSVEEIWLIEAKNADAAKRIMEAAQYRIDEKASETENYLPEQYAIVKQAKLLQQGNYIALFVSPNAEEMAKLFK